MPTRSNNKIVVDLDKCCYCIFGYRNQWGDTVSVAPKYSVRGTVFNPDAPSFALESKTNETMLEKAKRLNILDIWTPVFKCRLSAADVLEFSGPKAVALNKAWNAKIFKKK